MCVIAHILEIQEWFFIGFSIKTYYTGIHTYTLHTHKHTPHLGKAVCCLHSDFVVELCVEYGLSQQVSTGRRGEGLKCLYCLHRYYV